MEGIAEPGTTYVTGDTFKLAEGLFRFEAIGEKQIKGKHDPVPVYRVISASSRKTRFDVNAERGLSPFVGRGRELENLLDGFRRSKDGHGQAFSIMSEAGAGKSRLLYEFRKAIANEDVTLLEGKCLSYSRGIAYSPVIDILKSIFDVRDEDNDSEIIDKVKAGLSFLKLDEPSTLPFILELLSIRDSGINYLLLSPEAKRERIIKSLKNILIKGAEQRPLILIFEDLHWIDKSSEQALIDILGIISGARVFLVSTYRPNYEQAWVNKSYHTQINLQSLSRVESLSIARHLLQADRMTPELEDMVIEKTEGNPFFIEEFIKVLRDLKIVERKNGTCSLTGGMQLLDVPSTIHDIIMARVDTQPEVAKEILQAGSVIEREFSYGLILLVTGLDKEILLSNLAMLKDSELIYERGVYPDNVFIFKHALIREVAYKSLLDKKRKEFHNKVGTSLEKLNKDKITEYYGVLVEHFLEAGNFAKGAEYAKLAGHKSNAESAFVDAIEYAKKGIFCLENLAQTEKTKKHLIDARTVQGIYYSAMNYHVEAQEAVEPIVDLAIGLNYQKRLHQIYTILGTYNCYVADNLNETIKYLKEAIKYSELTDDYFSLANASFWLGTARAYNCEFAKSLNSLETGLRIAESFNHLTWISVFKSAVGVLVHSARGRCDLSYQASREAVDAAEENDDIFSKGLAYTALGYSLYGKGLFSQAIENLFKAVDCHERTKFYSWNTLSHQTIAEIYYEIGEYQKSKKHFQRAIMLLKQNRIMPSWRNLNEIGFIMSSVMSNQNDMDLDLIDTHVSNIKYNLFDGWVRRYAAETFLNAPENYEQEAENYISRAIEKDTFNGMMWHSARNYVIYSELLNKKGDRSKAKETLGKAIDIFKECGADGWVEKYEKEFAEL